MPFPELNLSLGITDNKGSVFYAGAGEGQVVTRVDSALKTHTISIIISEEQEGTVKLKTNFEGVEIPAEIEVPTYRMIVTDDKTNEKEVYKITRDTFSYKEQSAKKGLWSFLGLKYFAPKNFIFENIPFEPLNEMLEIFDISKYRKLTQNQLTYTFQKENQIIQIFAGDINDLHVKKGNMYFIIVDEKKGQRFIGDILFREKFLKLTPAVKLHLIKRKPVSLSMEVNKKGQINRLIYI